MGNIGAPEIIGLLLLALLLFGAKRLPEIGRSLGSGMREFKDSVSGMTKSDDDEPPTHVHTHEVHTHELPVATQDTPAPAPPRENETVL
jgi:sec-independent protein translocase protein TatA